MLRELLSRHPLLIVVDVVALVTAAGCVMVLLREAALFRNYRGLKGVAKGIAKRVHGTIFRDGPALVINGFHRGIPVVVRFSVDENTPDVNLWMRVHSRFDLFAFHNSSQIAEGKMRIPTGDRWFDERFTIRTSDRENVLAFLSDKSALEDIKQLCCSPGTLVALGKESLEVSERTIPTNTLQHLLDHLDSLGKTAARVGALSRASKAKTRIYLPDRYIAARIALSLLVIAGLVEVVTAVRGYQSSQPRITASSPTGPRIAAEDELLMPSATEWRLAEPSEFDGNTVAWFHEHGLDVKSRFDGGFNRSGEGYSRAYVLVRTNTQANSVWRVVLLAQNRRQLDLSFQNVLGVVQIPNAALSRIRWKPSESSVGPPDGDGLMVIRKEGETQTATVFDLSEGNLQSQTPADVWSTDLQSK